MKRIKLLTIGNCLWNSFTMSIISVTAKSCFFCVDFRNPVQDFPYFLYRFRNPFFILKSKLILKNLSSRKFQILKSPTTFVFWLKPSSDVFFVKYLVEPILAVQGVLGSSGSGFVKNRGHWSLILQIRPRFPLGKTLLNNFRVLSFYRFGL